ncbi:MAG: hypothetical protein AABW82_03030 [Nanoarchaeota archaeon]
MPSVETLRRLVGGITRGYVDLAQSNFDKGDYDSVQDRWQGVLLANQYIALRDFIAGELHCGSSFCAEVDVATELLSRNDFARAKSLEKRIRAYAAQTGLEFSDDCK